MSDQRESVNKESAIKVDGMWKYYGLPPLQYSYVARHWWNTLRYGRKNLPVQPPNPQTTWALKNISFEAYRGEMLGIIGLNGSGKSTLLKVLAGTTPPNYGSVEVHGKLCSMIELSAGMNPELSGRENCKLLGAVMGFTPREILEHIPAIEDFCELGEWFDRPIRTYSSGMMARLGFGVAVNVNADILLVDEVLAVGDIPFQRKSFDRMEKVRNSNKTIVYVSHSVRQVERLCDRVLLLNGGEVVAIGSPTEVVSIFEEITNIKTEQGKKHVSSLGVNFDTSSTKNPHEEDSVGDKVGPVMVRFEDSQIELVNVRLYNQKGEKTDVFYTGDTMYGEIEYTSEVVVENVIAGLAFSTLDRLAIFGFTSESLDFPLPISPHGFLRFKIDSLPLLKGTYTMKFKIKKYNGGTVGGGYDIKTFKVLVPGDIRLSSDFGFIKANSFWLPIEQPFPFQEKLN